MRKLLNYYDFEKSRNEFLPKSFYFSLDEEIKKIDGEMSYHNTELYKKKQDCRILGSYFEEDNYIPTRIDVTHITQSLLSIDCYLF